MHICMVMSTKMPPEEGIGNHVYNISQKLIQRGHEVTVITRGSWRQQPVEALDGIRLFRVRFLPVYPFHVHVHGVFVNRLLKKLRPELDVVHLHTPLVPPVKTSVPIMTTFHTPMKADIRSVEMVNLYALAVKLQAPVSYRVERKLLARSKLLATVSRSVAGELAEYGTRPEVVEVIGQGVDNVLFAPARGEAETGETYILNVGRLAYRKGLFDLVQCAEFVCQRYPDVKFVVVGKGPIEAKLRRAVAGMGLEGKFDFPGYINHSRHSLVRMYQRAAVYVQASHYEGLPITLLEAMACGCPVVATAVSGNLDAISSGENGILVPAKSPSEMAEAILQLLGNQELSNRLGQAARRTVEEGFTWDVVADRLMSCYERLA